MDAAREERDVYGYSASIAAVDEAWEIRPAAIDDALLPTMVEREQAQLLLVSTAHRLVDDLDAEPPPCRPGQLEAGDGDLLIEWSRSGGCGLGRRGRVAAGVAALDAGPGTPDRERPGRRSGGARRGSGGAGSDRVVQLAVAEPVAAQAGGAARGDGALAPRGLVGGAARAGAQERRADLGGGGGRLRDGRRRRRRRPGWRTGASSWTAGSARTGTPPSPTWRSSAAAGRSASCLVGASLMDRVPAGLGVTAEPVGGKQTRTGSRSYATSRSAGCSSTTMTPELDSRSRRRRCGRRRRGCSSSPEVVPIWSGRRCGRRARRISRRRCLLSTELAPGGPPPGAKPLLHLTRCGTVTQPLACSYPPIGLAATGYCVGSQNGRGAALTAPAQTPKEKLRCEPSLALSSSSVHAGSRSNRWHRSTLISTSPSAMSAPPRCSIESCERTPKARGLCKRHWHDWSRVHNPRGCRVPGCANGHEAHGYCRRHYDRSRYEPKPRKSVDERFCEKIRIESNGCWIWIGARDSSGYGNFRMWPRTLGAHRFAYEFVKGPIPLDHELDHVCRVRICVNPDHLEPVTPSENKRRAQDKSWTPSA